MLDASSVTQVWQVLGRAVEEEFIADQLLRLCVTRTGIARRAPTQDR
jgi:hypothetical protein